MLEPLKTRAALTLLWSALTIAGVACSKQSETVKIPQKPLAVPSTPTMVDSAVSQKETSNPKPLSNQTTKKTVEPTFFEMGLDKASGGFSVSQSAQSSQDWQLVADYYQDAINLMKSVSSQSRYYPIAKVKVREYQRHFDYALEKSVALQQPKPEPEPDTIVVTVPPLKESIAKQSIASRKMQVPKAVQKILQQNLQSQAPAVPEQIPTSLPQAAKPPQPTPTPVPVPIPVDTKSVYAAVPIPQKNPQVMTFTAPIKRRIGGTPIINVTFNGKQQFEMIVDTGASGTVITQRMANLLGVITVGKAKANTASAQSVEFPIGYVDSMEAGGVKVKKVAVAIAGAELQNGLLGHDFFGNYDITIKSNVVEFRPRSESEIPQQKAQKETRKSIPIYPKKLFEE